MLLAPLLKKRGAISDIFQFAFASAAGFHVTEVFSVFFRGAGTCARALSRSRNIGVKIDPLNRAGFVLGVGLGGFADGIILHQILQWHHMICTTATCEVHTLAAFKRQTFQDGLFHLAMWITVIIGIGLLFRGMAHSAVKPSTKAFVGSICVGWGCFNMIEGIIDHHLLGIHHVIAGSPHQLTADLVFLGASFVLTLFGMALQRNGRNRSDASGSLLRP
ncbi:MAG: hypothetical protein JWL90_1821 [Chthoniobacteraceae bacterium]|nr:hypothetical protein [Chthoniobacteraceae bacterium]